MTVYNRKPIGRVLTDAWTSTKSILEQIFILVDEEFKKIKVLIDDVLSSSVTPGLNADMVDSVHVDTLTDARLLRYESTGTKIQNATVTETSGALGGITTLAMSGALTNTLAIGNAPLNVTSTTVCSNLNADTTDGKHVAGTNGAGEITTNDGTQTLTSKTLTSPDINGGTVDAITSLTVANNVDIGAYELRAETLESDVMTGTAPLTITSTTKVTNLNADKVDGEDITEAVDTASSDTKGYRVIGDELDQWGLKTSSASADVEITMSQAYGNTADRFCFGQFATTEVGYIDLYPKPLSAGSSTVLEFNGSTQYVSVPHDSTLDVSTAGTWMAWIYLDTPSNNFQSIFHKAAGAGAGEYDFYYHAGTTLYLEINGTYATKAVVLSTATWYHVCVTWNKPTVIWYINGASSGTGSINVTASTNTDPVLIANGSAYTSPLDGRMFDARIYNTVVSAADIATIYAGNGVDTITTGLQGRWKLNEGADGTTATGTGTILDVSANLNHGDPQASPTYRSSSFSSGGGTTYYPTKLILGAYDTDGTTRIAKDIMWRCVGKKA